MRTETIKVDDRVEISTPGFTVRGKVLSASWYGERDGWHIELRSDAGRYHYWKHGSDGGSVRKVAA